MSQSLEKKECKSLLKMWGNIYSRLVHTVVGYKEFILKCYSMWLVHKCVVLCLLIVIEDMNDIDALPVLSSS